MVGEHSTLSVLVVEDDRINGFIIKKFLEKNYDVVIAENGHIALRKAAENAFDIVLMDINLGDEELDGVEVMKRLRESDTYVSKPIIATTAYALTGDKERFLNAGFSGYLAKPIKREELLNAITQELNTQP